MCDVLQEARALCGGGGGMQAQPAAARQACVVGSGASCVAQPRHSVYGCAGAVAQHASAAAQDASAAAQHASAAAQHASAVACMCLLARCAHGTRRVSTLCAWHTAREHAGHTMRMVIDAAAVFCLWAEEGRARSARAHERPWPARLCACRCANGWHPWPARACAHAAAPAAGMLCAAAGLGWGWWLSMRTGDGASFAGSNAGAIGVACVSGQNAARERLLRCRLCCRGRSLAARNSCTASWQTFAGRPCLAELRAQHRRQHAPCRACSRACGCKAGAGPRKTHG
eukprot:364287-Chlamydomonas_euryale.AAC.17